MNVLERAACQWSGPFQHIYKLCSGPQPSLLETEMHSNASVVFKFDGDEIPHTSFSEIPDIPIKSLGTCIFSHNQTFGIVGNEPINLLTSVKCRITANTPDPTVKDCLMDVCNMLIGTRFDYGFPEQINGVIRSFLTQPLRAVPIEVVLSKYSGPKLARYNKALENCNLMDDTYYLGDITEANYKELCQRVLSYGNDCFHKREKLWYKEMEDNGLLKPRLIINPAVEVQLWLMQYEKPLKKAFENFTRDPFVIKTKSHGNLKVRFDFAANVGTNTESLTAWIKTAHADLDAEVWTFILMGDDIYGVTLRDRRPYYIELDYSAFDSTQKDDAITAEHNLYTALGLPFEAMKVSLAQHKAPIYATKKKKLDGVEYCFQVMIVLRHLLRISGGWNTSLGGSLVNMFGLCHVLTTMDFHAYNTFEQVGFKIKASAYLKTYNILECTFLKCGFTRTKECVLLPSRILKVGTYTKAVKQAEALTYLKGDVLGWGNISHDFPILGPFREKVLSLVHGEGVDSSNKPDFIRTKQVGCVDRESVLELMLERYGLTEEEIVRLEDQIHGIKSFPWHISNPIFTILRERDY